MPSSKPTQIATSLTVSAVAAILSCSTRMVRNHIASGALQAVNAGEGKLKPLYRIEPAALEAFLASRRTATAQHEQKAQ